MRFSLQHPSACNFVFRTCRYTYKLGHRLVNGTTVWSQEYQFKSSPYPGQNSVQRVVIFGDMGKVIFFISFFSWQSNSNHVRNSEDTIIILNKRALKSASYENLFKQSLLLIWHLNFSFCFGMSRQKLMAPMSITISSRVHSILRIRLFKTWRT